MIFTSTDIAAHFSSDRFNKGWQLFADGRVSTPNIQRGGELITALIPQAGSRQLRVYVRMDRVKNDIVINGECSCATRKNCEHVAAVLLQALEDQQKLLAKKDAAPPSMARETAGESRNKAATIRAQRQQALVYILRLDETGVLIEPCVARRLLRGGHSAVRYYEPGRATSHTPARFLEPVDLELLSALDRSPRAPGTGIPLLDGPHSALLLEALLVTGRCYFEAAEWGLRLSPGSARRIEFQWQMDDFGCQRADWRITPEANTLLPLSAPWYLDSHNGQCGPLQSDLQPGLIHELVNLPAVPPEQSDKVQQRLQRIWPESAVPPLRQLEIETAPRLKPVPCLHLTTVEEQDWAEWSEQYDFASLSFDYGGIELSRITPSTRIKEGRLIRVQRDNKAEKAALNRLHQLGFEEDEAWSRHIGGDCFFPEFDFPDSETEVWLDFQLEAVPALRAEGWRIAFDHFRYHLSEVSNWVCDVDRLEQKDWFSVGLGVEVDGQHTDLLPILLEFLGRFPHGLPDREAVETEHFIVPFTDKQEEQRLLRLPAARVLPLLEILLEIYDGAAPAGSTQLHFNRVQLASLTALDRMDDDSHLQWRADDDIRQLAGRLRDLDGIPEVAPPAGLMTKLRPYQQQGLDWLQFLREYGLAGILADDMGLGKTVQALAHLLLEKEAGRSDRPSLVIAPTSLMFNWRHEAERFAPQLKVLVLHGPKRKEFFLSIAEHDLVITTYPLLARDRNALLAQRYHLVILDEAQVVKNPKAQAGRVAREIDARHRLCLTGTPLENHLGELWSLFDFLLPGLLGNSKQFRRFFRTPIEKNGSEAVSHRLSRRIRPFLVRRTKQQVAAELPPKTEIIQSVALEGRQRELYETVRLAMHHRVREEIERQGLARSHIVVLDALLKLRQVCCHPGLVKMEKAQPVKQSAKLAMLMEMLPEMIEEGRRILLFSQFTEMLGLIEDELKKAGIGYVKLTGRTRDRENPVRRFQDGETPLFLISLKAGGVGLNLTAADTVIHYDPWWNPAVERQATDRAHRIGQQQKVFVYKLICEGTLEEKIQVMQQRKQALADNLYRDGANNEPQWDEKDLETLFGPLDKDEESGTAVHNAEDYICQGR